MSRLLTYLKNPWVLLALAVVVIVVVWKLKGGSLININRPTPLPTDNAGGELTDSEAQAVREIAMRLHSDMDGFTVVRDRETYREWMSMPDRLFVAVYNDFNNLYFNDGQGTLRQWIANEGPWWGDFDSKANIIERMDRLNLN